MLTTIHRWCKRLFGITSSERGYSASDRLVYAYFNGRVLVKVDPKVIYKKVMDIGPELSVDLRVSESISRDAKVAHASLIQKIRSIFDLASSQDNGLTETEAVELFGHFMGYISALRTKYEEVLDDVEHHGGFLAYYGRQPTYTESFGMWLNRKRLQYRKAGYVMLGVGIAMGYIDPGMAFYRAITDGEGEAIALKGVQDAMRRQKND